MPVEEFKAVQMKLDGGPGVRVHKAGEIIEQLLLAELGNTLVEMIP